MAKSQLANLGMAYYNGDGVPQDAVKASQWLKLAEAEFFRQILLGLWLIEGEGGIRKTPTKGFPRCGSGRSKSSACPPISSKKRGSNQPLRKQVPTQSPGFSNSFKTDEEVLDEARGTVRVSVFLRITAGPQLVTLGQRRILLPFCRAYGVNGKRNEKDRPRPSMVMFRHKKEIKPRNGCWTVIIIVLILFEQGIDCGF